MKCEECGALMTVERNGVRRYVIGGLPHVELHGVEVSQCQQCGTEEVGIPRIEQLHRALAAAFVRQPRMVASAELRFLRKHLGLSAGDFARMMGVTRETVSRWETGAKPMGSVADRLLRLLVLSHTPTESYEVDDLLNELTNDPAPKKLTSIAMWNNSGGGWLTQEKPPAAAART
jgi:putative zinc finger/helix-turn-helix YgiT family protein